MPKRGSRARNWRDNDHFEHDDRAPSTTRRVSFKAGTNKGKNKFNSKALMLDDDIDMGAQGVSRRGAFRGRGGGRIPPAAMGSRSQAPKKRFIAGGLPWYQVLIPYGAKHEKDVILKTLLSFVAPETFNPHYYRVNGNAAIFYIDDVKMAEKLFYADRRITMSDGFKMLVIVRNAIPNVVINAEMKEKMTLTMGKRYNAVTKALDLTKFHAHPDLEDLFCPLFRPAIMLEVISIIAENIPDLEALNLNDNKLYNLDHMKNLGTTLKNLKILYMGDNKISHIGALEPLRNIPLVELYLKGNPFEVRLSANDTYTRVYLDIVAMLFVFSSEIRKRFPKVLKLDGVELPPAIGFDVSEDATLPARQQSFLVDPAGQVLVRDFLTQYFAIYDSESRQALLAAYHENATLSMAANYLSSDRDNRNVSNAKLNAYISSSRNLLRVTERESRRRYLRNGPVQVVSFLSDLPKTTHDLMGFAVDLLVFTPQMIVLTMNGVFKETTTPNTPTRSFHRTFVIVPNSAGGFSIMNDILFISNTTREQEDKAFTAGGVAEPAAAPAPAAIAAAAAPFDDEAKKVVLMMLSQQTGMNEHWSINCLQETGWDLQRALFIFNQLQSTGKIPPEAFIK